MSTASKGRVLQILETYLPLIGGAEFHLHYLTRELIARGYEVEIVTGLDDPPEPGADICKVHRLPHAVGRSALPWTLLWLVRFVRMFRQFDVIHAHHSSFLAFVAVIAGFVTGKGVIVTLHGLGALDSSVGNCPIRRLYRWVSLKGAARIIATSDEMAELARRFVPAERIALITNGVATERFAPSHARSFEGVTETLRLATLRRMNPKNGVHFVVDALGRAKDQLRFTLRMAGDGPLRPMIEGIVADHGIGDQVKFEGFLSHGQVIPLLEDCDAALFLSTAESTSLAALECMAMGCIVICSNAGAFPLFVQNGKTGFIIELFPEGQSDYDAPMRLEPGQYRKIAETLAAIQAMPAAELKMISEQARDYVRNYFDWAVITARTVEQVYNHPAIKRT
ncbi:MAG: glycosyltransferase family 4 protein [Rhodospirillaceae bacterium]